MEASQTKLMNSKEQLAVELEMTQRALDRVVSENNQLHNEVAQLNRALIEPDEEHVGIINEVFHFDGDESTGTAAQADVITSSGGKSAAAIGDSDIHITISDECVPREVKNGIDDDDGTE